MAGLLLMLLAWTVRGVHAAGGSYTIDGDGLDSCCNNDTTVEANCTIQAIGDECSYECGVCGPVSLVWFDRSVTLFAQFIVFVVLIGAYYAHRAYCEDRTAPRSVDDAKALASEEIGKKGSRASAKRIIA